MVECVGKATICSQVVNAFDEIDDVKVRVGRKYIYIQFNDLMIKMEVRNSPDVFNKIAELIDAIINADSVGDIPPKAYEL